MSLSNEQPSLSEEQLMLHALTIYSVEEEEAVEDFADENKTLEGLSILLAEDQVILQIIGMKMLKALGASVFAVRNGVKAVEAMTSMLEGVKARKESEFKFREGSPAETAEFPHYDLILMDCQMPEMDGYEATREIRKLEAEAEVELGILIIAFTSNEPESNVKECFAAGMDVYVQKPVAEDVMASTILSALAEKRTKGSCEANDVEQIS